MGAWEGSAASPSAYESYAITTFTLGVPTCTSASMTPSLASPQAAGVALTFGASASRCTGGQFEYWVLAPAGVWTVKQAYSSQSWTWSTAGEGPGIYQVGVWSRQAGSTAPFDAYFISTYQLTG